VGASNTHWPASLQGKTVLITGGNSGIGTQTAVAFAKLGASHIIITGRDTKRNAEAVKEIEQAAPKNGKVSVKCYTMDLGDLASVRAFAAEVKQHYGTIDFLINNAAVMMCPYGKTKDGFENHFGINHLGHFLLTNLVLDKMASDARIVNVSAGLYLLCKNTGIQFDNLTFDKPGTTYSALYCYGHSKLAVNMFARELQKRLDAKQQGNNKIKVTSLHPGVIQTNLSRHFSWFTMFALAPLRWLFMKTPEQGIQTIMYCALNPAIEGGAYYDNCHLSPLLPVACDDKACEKLWTVSEQLVGVSSVLCNTTSIM